MHSKFNKMRFERLNNNNTSEQGFEDGKKSEYNGEENDLNLNQITSDSSDMLTLEGLRRTYNSCSNCGVCWYDDHVSLDCTECGGYALCRPCPTCNGQCGNMWRRDVKASRVNKNAQWHGSCSLNFQWKSKSLLESQTLVEDANANFHSSYRNLSQNLVKSSQIHL